MILTWLGDLNKVDREEALKALAAYLRVRMKAAESEAVERVPAVANKAPSLSGLIEVLEGFVSSDPEGGARGMAAVAAVFKAVGFDPDIPSRNDPRPIDIPVKRDGRMVIGVEVKQVETGEATAQTLVEQVATTQAQVALLAVLRPGRIENFSRSRVVQAAEKEHGVVLRVADGVREVVHEALAHGMIEVSRFCATLPRAFAEALREINAAEESIETWASISSRWR